MTATATEISEAEFQTQVMQLASMLGWHVLHVRKSIGRRGSKRAWQTTTNIAGWVDLLLWRPGRIVAAELKAAKGRVTVEQREVLESLAAAGVDCHVWRPTDFDEIRRVLNPRPQGAR